LVGALLCGSPGVAAQSDHGFSDAQLASLLVSVADFHAENGRGPLESCAVLRATGVSPARLIEADPRLVRVFDEVERPCEIQRHHPTLFNRLILAAVEPARDEMSVRYESQVSDRFATWELTFRELNGAWVKTSGEEVSVMSSMAAQTASVRAPCRRSPSFSPPKSGRASEWIHE
jgi:hypothetical protein